MNNEEKYREMFNVCIQWVDLKQKNIQIDQYIRGMGYSTVAIYGMGDIGNRLVKELVESKEVEFLYAIDQGNPKLYYDVKCIRLEDISNERDADIIIVTLPHIFEKLEHTIGEYVNCRIMSITQLIYDASYLDNSEAAKCAEY